MNANEPIKHSTRLGKISQAQFQAALDHFSLGQFVSAEAVGEGLFKQNVLLNSTKGEFVFRGNPFGPWHLPKELFFAKLIHEKTNAPGPWPYLFDDRKELFPWDYAIMQRLPGITTQVKASNGEFSRKERLQIAKALGSTLREMHKITFPHIGMYEVSKDDIVSHGMSHKERVIHWIRESLEHSLKIPAHTSNEDADWVEQMIVANANALEAPFVPTYVHHDYREGNTVFTKTTKGWQLTGVFDLMEAYSGAPGEDFGRVLAGPLRQRDFEWVTTFLDAYFQNDDRGPAFVQRLKMYVLNDRIGIWSYGCHHGWYKEGQTMKKCLWKCFAFDENDLSV